MDRARHRGRLARGRDGRRFRCDEAERLDRSRVAAVAQSDRGDLGDLVRAQTNGRGADLALNGVGAAIFDGLFSALRKGGRMVVYSAAAGREATLNLFELYRNRLQIFGVDTAMVDAAACARILTNLTPLFESGALHPRSDRGTVSAFARCRSVLGREGRRGGKGRSHDGNAAK